MAQGITLAKAIAKFSRELGCSDEDNRESLIDEITSATEFLMLNGGGDILREWVVPVRNGRSTLPRDLNTPIKYKWGRLANSGFGTFASPYLNYSSQGIQNCCGLDWKTTFNIRANKTPVQYQPPCCGVRVVATTRDKRDVGKSIFVAGKKNGMPIAATHNGYKTGGELLTVYAENDKNKRYSAFWFDEITSVVRDETCSYTMLSGLDCNRVFHHLAFYHPDETVPQYTEIEMVNCPVCRDPGYESAIHILGRVEPSIRFLRNEDILPIQTQDMLNLLAKRARYDSSGDYDVVAAMEQRIRNLIKRTVSYQQSANRQLSVNLAASGYTLSNV